MAQKQETWLTINCGPQSPCHVLKTAAQTGLDKQGWGGEAGTPKPVPLAGSLMKFKELGLQKRQMICTLFPATKEIQFQETKEEQGSS